MLNGELLEINPRKRRRKSHSRRGKKLGQIYPTLRYQVQGLGRRGRKGHGRRRIGQMPVLRYQVGSIGRRRGHGRRRLSLRRRFLFGDIGRKARKGHGRRRSRVGTFEGKKRRKARKSHGRRKVARKGRKARKSHARRSRKTSRRSRKGHARRGKRIGQYPYMELRHQVMGIGARRRYLRDLFANPTRGWNWLFKKDRVMDLAGLGLGTVVNRALHLVRERIPGVSKFDGNRIARKGMLAVTDLVGAIAAYEVGGLVGGKKRGQALAETGAIANLAAVVGHIVDPIVGMIAHPAGLLPKSAKSPVKQEAAVKTASTNGIQGLGVVYEAEGEARRIGVVYESDSEARRIGMGYNPAAGKSHQPLPDEEFSADVYPSEEKSAMQGVSDLPEREFKERLAQAELPEREFKERLGTDGMDGEDVFGDVGDSPF